MNVLNIEATSKEDLIAKLEQALDSLVPDAVLNLVTGEEFHQFKGVSAVVCCLRTTLGWPATGECLSGDPETFDPEVAQRVARFAAFQKLVRFVMQEAEACMCEKCQAERVKH